MKKIVYEGKTYYEPAKDSQRLFQALDMHSFRYYPQDKLVILSDLCCKYFQSQKIFANAPESLVEMGTYSEDRAKHLELYSRINSGEKKVSGNIRITDGQYYKVTMTILESDQQGRPLVVAGVFEEFDKQMMSTEVTRMLSSDYMSVYLIDFETGKIFPYRISEYARNYFTDEVTEIDNGARVLNMTLERYVVPEELAEMKHVVSLENLQERLHEKSVYMHDFRVVINGLPLYYRFKASNMSDGKLITRAVVGFADVSKEKAGEWKRLAYMDVVTGGYNFTYFKEHLKQEIHEGYIVSVDMRSFKIINSVCGLETGDLILRTVSEIVASKVQPKGFYGHVNADRFAMFIPAETEKEIVDILEDITREILYLAPKFNVPKLMPYYGITRWKPGMRIEVTFSETETAKNNAKNDKDCNYRFYRIEDIHKAVEEKEMESAFDQAIETREFDIWYQPKYSPVDRRMIGAEALVRWKRQNGDMIFPNKFIPVFEKAGLIRKLDEYVFRTVCYQQKHWLDVFGITVPVSVNLSRASLYFETVVNRYKAIAQEAGISPELVPIEITESAAVNNSNIKIMADKFYNAGFPLQMDDFGTGYSSLSTLNVMRFDTIKLDKSLIDYIGNYGGERLIHHTVALAKELGIHVTAEGVEKESQVIFLKNLDCDSIQGYYFAKPMPAKAFEEQIKQL